MRHWFRRWIRRFRRGPQQPIRRRPLVYVEALEDRCLLAAPVLDPIQVPLNIPVGKTLVVPISGTDPAGGPVTYTVTSSNPKVTVLTHSNNTFLQMTVTQGTTTLGTMEFELFNDLTPKTAGLIASMVKSEFYNGLTFHRIVPNFVIQGGDPAGNGTGGPGFTFDDEFNSQLVYSGTGQLAMANTGKDSNGSQFFVTVGPQRPLDFNNAIFGQLVRGFDVLQKIDNVPTDSNNKPLTPVVISNAQVVQDNTDTVITLQSTGTGVDSTTLTIIGKDSAGTSSTPMMVTANVVPDSVGAAGTPTSDPPILGPITDQVSPTGTPITFQLTRSDLENDASDFEANLVNASDSNNVTVTVTPAADNASATVTVTPKTVSGAAFTGSVQLLVGTKEHNATARGSTTSGPAIFDTQQIAVSFGDQPLTYTPATTVAATEGTAATNVTLGTLTDADTTAQPADYQVSINWGDGTPLDTTSGKAVAVTGTPGRFTITGTHTYKDAATIMPVEVNIVDIHTSTTAGADKGGATAEAATTAIVADANLTGAQGATINATAGTPLNNAVVATFSDADPNAKAGEYTATINWGDGSPSSTGTVQAGSTAGQFQVLGSHTFATKGNFSPAVSVTDVNTANDATPATTSATATANVAAAPQTPQTPTIGPTLSVNQLYVDQLFFDLLGVTPTSQQLNQFSGQLDGGTSRATVIQAIQALPQYKTHRVTQAYNFLLGQAPTAKQVSDGVNFLSGKGKMGDLRVQIMASQDFFRVHGGNNSGFASAVGHAILGHALDAATLAQFLGVLGSQSRAAAVRDLYRIHTKEAQTAGVNTEYELYLHRAATATELSTQIAALDKGLTEDQLIASIVALNDYFNRALQTVSPVVSNTTLTSSATPAALGQSVTFTAAVSSAVPGAGTPTGTVTFTDQTTGKTLGTGPVNASGQATFSTSSLLGGAHTIVASYPGDSRFTASTNLMTETVSVASTTTAVTTSQTPSVSGQAVTFTATVTPSTSGVGTPTGAVTFTDQTTGTTLGTGTLNSSGVATFSTALLSVGAHTIVASYGGDTNFGSSTGNVSQTVNAAATSTAVTAAPSPATFGQSVTLTATVTTTAPGTGTPTGTVTFTDQTTGTTLGTGTLNASGVATLNVSTLAAGAHTIVASYGATGNFAASSGNVSETINPSATSTSVTAAPSPSTFGQTVTMTATVTATAPGVGTPTGTVTFTDMASGTTLGTGTLNASGVATATTTALTAGTHTIVASYGATTNFSASSGNTMQTVNQAATVTMTGSSPNPSAAGQMVTFTANVTSPGGTPAGMVTFVDQSATPPSTLGSGTLDANGMATFSTTTLAVGTHNVQASYGGNTNFAGSNNTVTQTVHA
jgi:cyclophilin family peptidyl-prolyl cis-trans isomerase